MAKAFHPIGLSRETYLEFRKYKFALQAKRIDERVTDSVVVSELLKMVKPQKAKTPKKKNKKS